MPACQGRPDGPCPDSRNDKTVRFTQGDLFLCDACDKFRFPINDCRQVAASSRKIVDTRGSRSNSDVQVTSRQLASEDSRSSDVYGSSRPKDLAATSAVSVAASTAPHLIVDELLSLCELLQK